MKVLFIQGPTASGKSAVALRLASKFGGAIVNGDSIQCYSGCQIGAAAPSGQERNQCPHLLFNFVQPPDELTAGRYAREALAVLHGLASVTDLAIVVGGTGFYFQALELGPLPIPAVDQGRQAKILQELAKPGGEQHLYSELVQRDPVLARRFASRDHFRLVRALEVLRQLPADETWTQIEEQHRKNSKFPFELLKIAIDPGRELLKKRIQSRCEKMFADGFWQEVLHLKAQAPDWAPLRSVGYQQVVQAIDAGKVSPDATLIEDIVMQTSRLAKKQRTWLRSQADLTVFHPDEYPQLETLVTSFLNLRANPAD